MLWSQVSPAAEKSADLCSSDIVHSVLLCDPAFFQVYDICAAFNDELGIVGHYIDRMPRCLQLSEQVRRFQHVPVVEAAGGFVEEQDGSF